MHTRPRAWSPAPLGSSTIEKHYSPIQHKYWCVKSAKLCGESWSPGLWSLSPRIRHIHHWCRDSCAQSNTFFSPVSYLKAERMAQQRKVFYTESSDPSPCREDGLLSGSVLFYHMCSQSPLTKPSATTNLCRQNEMHFIMTCWHSQVSETPF